MAILAVKLDGMHKVHSLETRGADKEVKVGEISDAAIVVFDFDRVASNAVDRAGFEFDVVAGDRWEVIVGDDLLEEELVYDFRFE